MQNLSWCQCLTKRVLLCYRFGSSTGNMLFGDVDVEKLVQALETVKFRSLYKTKRGLYE